MGRVIENKYQFDLIRMHDVFEMLASLEHYQWSHWAKDLLGRNVDLGEELENRWRRQASELYIDLSEEEKEHDRHFARMVLLVLAQHNLLDRGLVSEIVGQEMADIWFETQFLLDKLRRRGELETLLS